MKIILGLFLLDAIVLTWTQNTPWVQWGQKAQLLKAFSNGTPVYGILSYNNMVAVIRENVTDLQVYSASQGLYSDMAPVPLTSSGFYDMAFLSKTNKLVLLNWFKSNQILVVQLRPPYNITTWNFTDGFTTAALSVTEPDQNIIVTDGVSRVVKIYSPVGNLLRTIRLQMARTPRQTIRLQNNLYAVSAGYEKTESHLICKFNILGFVVGRCFGGKPGNKTTQLNVPSRMVNLKDGSVLLADMLNARVLKLTSDLSSAQVVLDSADGIHQPYRLSIDENAGILYVADNILDPVTSYAVSGRVLAFRY